MPPPALAGVSSALALLLAAATARAADPGAAAYSRDPTRLFWILHVSDSHIGSEYFREDLRLAWVLGEALDVIAPLLVVNGGDLVDGSPFAVPTSGQDDGEWATYRNLVDDAGMTPDFYLDLVGNHDSYGSPGLTHYLTWSLTGSTTGGTSLAIPLALPFGEYLVYGIATPGEDGATFLEHPELSADELLELDATLTAHDAARLQLVFGHHALHQPDGGQDARAILQAHGALYFHGHRHELTSYLASGQLSYEIDTLGQGQERNVGVVAVDNDAVTHAATDSRDPWPFIVVTTPAERLLTDGTPSPYAYDVCQAGTDNPVRALVFDSQPVTGVTLGTAGGGEPVPMMQDGDEPRLWHGTWDVSALPPGEVVLTVTATGSATRSRDVHVLLADVPCPPALPPDAGPPDARPPDAAPSPDARPPDAAPAPDATPQGGDDGCACRAAADGRRRPRQGPFGTAPWVLLAALGAAAARSRRTASRTAR